MPSLSVLHRGLAVAMSASMLLACASGPDDSATPSTSVSPTSSVTPTTPESVPPATDAPSSTAGAPIGSEPQSDDVDAYLDRLENQGFDGVVAVRKGADISTRAYGVADREHDVPVDAETVFDIGSITKQFTGAAILRLEMDGVLTVDDPLGEHVPGLPDDKAAITLHQLLTHTSGLPAGLGPDEEPIGRSDFLTLVAETPLASEPGARFEYSNVGYALLAAVIEFETGEPYESYLHTALFEPAGMSDTGYVLPDWDGHTIAVGYDNPSGDRFGRPNEQPWDVDGPYWHLRGNGGILSTAADMLRWDEALLGDGVLDAPAKAKLFTPHVSEGPGADTRYGYGWVIVPTPMGTPLIAHNGGNGVFFADFLRFVDQDVAVFVATNSVRDDDETLAFEVASRLLDADLTAMFDGDVDAAARRCGFDGLSLDMLPDHPEIDTLPESPAGRTAMRFLDLLAEGDDADRLDFATDHVTEELAGDDPAAIADGVEALQEEFAGYEVVRILEQDDLRFHLLMRGPDADLLLSVGFDETDPERLTCLAVSA